MFVFTVLAICLLGFYIYRKWYCHNVFKSLGVPGPEPHWLFGTLLDLWVQNKAIVFDEWATQYGEIFGFYEGSTPVLMISNAQTVERMCIKQFSDFPGRKIIAAIQPDQEVTLDHPFLNVGSLWGPRWKRLRNILNPAFSTGKLKTYSCLIAKRQGDLIEQLEFYAKPGEKLNIMQLFELLTLDIIGEVAFGVELNCVKNPTGQSDQNPLLRLFREVIGSVFHEAWQFRLAATFPELGSLFRTIFDVSYRLGIGALPGAMKKLFSICQSIIQNRQENPDSRRNDVLQMMIDTMEPAGGSEYTPLTPKEITAQSIMILGAGFGTTSITLSFAAHLLATNPSVQEKVAHEILNAFSPIVDFSDAQQLQLDYDVVMNLPYLNSFVLETLRLYPVGAYVVQRFVQPNEVDFCGIPLPKGMHVCANTLTIHNDEKLWGPFPTDACCPERFEPQYKDFRPEGAFLGFGLGPRHCVGMRLALFEIKLTLCNLIRRFRILPVIDEVTGENEQLDIVVSRLITPKNGVVNVSLQLRA